MLSVSKTIWDTRGVLKKAAPPILLVAQKTILYSKTDMNKQLQRAIQKIHISKVKFQEYLANLSCLYFPYYVSRGMIWFFKNT